MRSVTIAALVALCGLAAGTAAAQTAPLSTQQILAKLKPGAAAPVDPDEDDGGFKSMRPRPDPVTKLCEPRPVRLGPPGVSGDDGFRNLVVRPAPKVDLTVEFDFGKDVLRPDGAAQLDALAGALKDATLATRVFSVVGHTDAVGTADANNQLSCGRALAAKKYLVERHQIQADRLVAMGMGFAEPINRANPRAPENRRVEVKHLAVP
jgi:outer membrane protein OmpA-like peptidoglycan-associated protein